MPLRCVICGMAHLPPERCGSDTEAGLAASAKLDRARAALARVEAPVREDRKEVRPLPSQTVPNLSKAPAESAKRPGPEGFDRNAYHKAYMKAYMRGWRARKRAK